MTIFLTTHRLEEAERLCHRVAILNTTLRLIGRPDELRDQLFSRSLDVRVRTPLEDPSAVLGGLPGVEGWEQAPSGYTLTVSDPELAAPQVARALVGAGADILSIAESRHSLEDVYLELIDEDVEAKTAMSFSWTRVGAILRQGAAGLSPQPLRDRHDDGVAAALRRPADDPAVPRRRRDGTSAKLNMRIGLSLLYMLVIPAFMPSALCRLLGGRRARAGHARARPDHPDPPRGVPHRQGAGRVRPDPRRSPTWSSASSSPPRPCSPIP